MIADAGWRTVGPARSVAAALDLIDNSILDGAILDIHLWQGERLLDVAAALRERRIPLFFATDVGSSDQRSAFENIPVLHKPFRSAQLVAAVQQYILGNDEPL